MPTRSILMLCGVIVACGAMSGCGGSSSAPRAPELVTDTRIVTTPTTAYTAPTTSTSTTTAVPAGECGPSDENCTPAAVMATLTRYYLAAGATRAEAACIVPVLASDAHAVNEAFDEPTAKQNQEGMACVESEARLRKVAYALRDWLVAQTPGASVVP